MEQEMVQKGLEVHNYLKTGRENVVATGLNLLSGQK
jgi:hypothetical protein